MMKQFCAALLLALSLFRAVPAQADIDPDTVQKLMEEGSEGFGISLSVDGNTIVIGTATNFIGGLGAAYVYTRACSDSAWSLQQKLTAPEGDPEIGFGESVAVDRDTIVVGRPDRDSFGSVYVYTRSGTAWTLQQELTANDGNAAEETPLLNGHVLGESEHVDPGDGFGCFIALDGDTLMISDNTTVHVFTRSGAVWRHRQKISPDGVPIYLAAPLLDGNTALISYQGSAYVFVRGKDGTWRQQQQFAPEESRGFFDLLSLDGDTILCGSSDDNNYTGMAYIFVRGKDGTWRQQQQLAASDGKPKNWFGCSGALNGGTALIGTNQRGRAAYVFVRGEDGIWREQQKLTEEGSWSFGSPVALDGDTALVSAFSGSVYVYSQPAACDSDRDGVADGDDQCPDTAPGVPVDLSGCSIAQICPCNDSWRTHGQYMRCVAGTVRKFIAAQLVTKRQGVRLIRAAARSQCGRNKRKPQRK